MAWIPSHQSLRSHPKTRKAARRANVSIPTMIGHLHLLWYWALDLADDGDLARFDDEDIADGAGWDGDPETFVNALVGCGSGGGVGFLTEDRQLHDWEEYGGKYSKRRESARKAAAVRWGQDEVPTDSDSNADAMRPHSDGNAEERRGEETREQRAKTSTSDLRPAVSDEATQLTRLLAEAVRANGHPVPKRDSAQAGTWLTEMDRLLRIGPPGWDGDPPTVDEVTTVIRWVAGDEFERANVRSVPKLRKRYSQLRLKALNTSARASPSAKGGQYADRYRQVAAELERQGR